MACIQLRRAQRTGMSLNSVKITVGWRGGTAWCCGLHSYDAHVVESLKEALPSHACLKSCISNLCVPVRPDVSSLPVSLLLSLPVALPRPPRVM